MKRVIASIATAVTLWARVKDTGFASQASGSLTSQVKRTLTLLSFESLISMTVFKSDSPRLGSPRPGRRRTSRVRVRVF